MVFRLAITVLIGCLCSYVCGMQHLATKGSAEVIFMVNEQPVACITTHMAQLLSPILKANIKNSNEMTGNLVGNNICINADQYSKESVAAFVDLLRLLMLDCTTDSVVNATRLFTHGSQVLSPILMHSLNKRMQNIIANPACFFELASLVDTYQVKLLENIVAQTLPRIIAEHIKEKDINTLNVESLPPFIKQVLLQVLAEDKHYSTVIVPSNRQNKPLTDRDYGVVNTHCVSSGDKYLATVEQRNIRVRDLNTLQDVVFQIDDDTEFMGFTPNNAVLIVAYKQGGLATIDLATKKIQTYLQGSNVKSFMVGPGSKHVAVHLNNNNTAFIDLASKTSVVFPNLFVGLADYGQKRYRDFSVDGKFFVTSYHNHSLVDFIDLETMQRISFDDEYKVDTVFFTPDNNHVVISYKTFGLLVKIIDLKTKKISTLIQEGREITAQHELVSDLVPSNVITCSRDGTLLACYSVFNGTTIVSNLATGTNTIYKDLLDATNMGTMLRFNNDGTTLFMVQDDSSGSHFCKVQALTIATHKIALVEAPVRYVSWTRDRNCMLWVSGNPSTTKILNLATNKIVQLPDMAYKALCTLDNRLLIWCSWLDGSVNVLDTVTNEKAVILKEAKASYDMVCAKDGRLIICRDQDRQIIDFGIKNVSFEHALGLAILEELKMAKDLDHVSSSELLHELFKGMPKDLQDYLSARYGYNKPSIGS